MKITKETKWQLLCRCHDNIYATGPVLITTKIPIFYFTQGSSTPNNLIGRVKTLWEPCLFRGKPPVPLKKVAKRFFIERDWNQGCYHGNNIVGVILFLLWCKFLMPSLKITPPIFLEIFLIQYFIVLVELFMTSSLSSFAWYKNVNISKTKKDIPKRKVPLFFTLKSLSNKQQLFFTYNFIGTLSSSKSCIKAWVAVFPLVDSFHFSKPVLIKHV